MKLIIHLFRILVFSNGLIALASITQSTLTYLILDLRINPLILIIEGCSTIALYNMSLFYAKPANPAASRFARTRWFFGHQQAMGIITAFACLLLAYSLFHIHWYTVFYLGFIGVLSLLYNIPFLRLGKHTGGLRQIPGLKLFHIALVWSLSTVGLPVVEAWAEGMPIDWTAANFLGIIKVLFLMVCTLPFDVRDIKQDSYYNLKTVPTMIGKQRSIQLNYVLIVCHTALIAVAPYALPIKFGLWMTNLFIFYLLRRFIFVTQQEHYHAVYLLDLALIVQFVCVALAIYFQ
ncbi:hypothetical protein M8998_09600 [Sphingobacterium sp. lm-10]|uniref:hypothetical protein n=1 Tax=Sphingobacterium sp. lm-10 TaxID=2944904 RepID=UPI002020393B|nr:hypothetical protein [Sphingobacterium sp. lm-10]MCL7988190.1 hypothetical protein [Sphingobacterium sp. lm-10]